MVRISYPFVMGLERQRVENGSRDPSRIYIILCVSALISQGLHVLLLLWLNLWNRKES